MSCHVPWAHHINGLLPFDTFNGSQNPTRKLRPLLHAAASHASSTTLQRTSHTCMKVCLSGCSIRYAMMLCVAALAGQQCAAASFDHSGGHSCCP